MEELARCTVAGEAPKLVKDPKGATPGSPQWEAIPTPSA